MGIHLHPRSLAWVIPFNAPSQYFKFSNSELVITKEDAPCKEEVKEVIPISSEKLKEKQSDLWQIHEKDLKVFSVFTAIIID